MTWKHCGNCDHYRPGYDGFGGTASSRCAFNAPKQGDDLPDAIGLCGQFEPNHSLLDALQEWANTQTHYGPGSAGLRPVLKELEAIDEQAKPRYREDGQRLCGLRFFADGAERGRYAHMCVRPWDHSGRCEVEDQPGDAKTEANT